jgi:hypothetical protein
MRNCETVGIPSMFRSRVEGVGITVPTAQEQREQSEQRDRNRPALDEYKRKLAAWTVGLNAARSQCPPIDPNIRFIQAPTCQFIEDYFKSNPMPVQPGDVPDPMMSRTSAAPTGSALPLLLGAAYLLLA